MPGPKRTPKKVLKARGSWRARRAANSPDAPEGCPPMPEWLDEYGVERWHELAHDLDTLGLLATTDGAAMAVLCETYSQWRACVDDVHEHGAFASIPTRDNGTQLKERPSSIKAKHLLPALDRQLSGFGLTPSSRASVKVPEKKPANVLDRYAPRAV